jgi:hypothetical protein
MYRMVFLFCLSCTACTPLRFTLPPHPTTPPRLSPDSEAHRRHTELELVWDQPAGPPDLITFIVDGTNRAAPQLARFSQSLYDQLARGLARRCPVRCLDAAWRILVHEVQPNVVVLAHGHERRHRLEVVGVYYIGERSASGLTALSQRAADRLTATLLRRQTRPPASSTDTAAPARAVVEGQVSGVNTGVVVSK